MPSFFRVLAKQSSTPLYCPCESPVPAAAGRGRKQGTGSSMTSGRSLYTYGPDSLRSQPPRIFNKTLTSPGIEASKVCRRPFLTP